MRYKILIADDEKVFVHLAESYLLNVGGFTVLKAYDGKNALDLVSQVHPDVVIADIQLPIINGWELAEKIHQLPASHNTPVIFTYSDNDDSILPHILDKKNTDILHKPFNKLELIARVNSALQLHDALLENDFQKQRIDNHIEELNKLSLIIKETENSVVIYSAKGEIEWANDGFTRLYGYTLAEFIKRFGNSIFNFPQNSLLVSQKFHEVVSKGASISFVSSFLRPNGQHCWIQTTFTPIFEGKRIEKVVAIETDITKEKEAELAIIRRNKEMEELTSKLKKINQELEQQKAMLLEERRKREELLNKIMPHHVVQQLMNEGSARPRNYKMATVMFTDFKGFTKACEHLTPNQIVDYLHGFFTEFDDIILDHYIEKIKTIGDAYMCVGGVPLRNRSNPFDVVLAGLEIQYFMTHLDQYDPDEKLPRWRLRVGIHTGPLVAGVVGKIKYAYDVWGDTVNIAQRMEQACEVGRVNVSAATYEKIKDYFDTEYRGEIEVKNRGKIAMYYVNGIKKEFAEDPEHIVPNETFRQFLNSL